MRTMMIAVLAAVLAPQLALAQDAIPLASQRKQVSPPQQWAEYIDETGLREPIWHPAMPKAPSVKTAEVGVRIDVGSHGLVTGCTVTKPSRFGELNESSCEGLLSRRIQPARDSTGRPMAVRFDTVVHWRLGGEAPAMVPQVSISALSPSRQMQPASLWRFPASDTWTVNPTPRGNPQGWINNDDYPALALRSEQQGVVGFTLLIDAAGVPLDCMVALSSGSTLLDWYTCDLMETRARFNPARNAQGVLVPSTWSSRMRWVLPQD